jgi:hypothetical protein
LFSTAGAATDMLVIPGIWLSNNHIDLDVTGTRLAVRKNCQ